jgi:hypothetical protein
MKTIINWKVFFILWIAAILATIAVIPYIMDLQASALTIANLPMSLLALIALQIVQNAVLCAILIFDGLFFAGRVGLGAPILETATRGEPVAGKVRAILPLSIGLGIIVTLIVLGLEFYFFQPALARELGGAANILAAVLFGLGRLPILTLLVPLTPLVIARTVVLNGLLGIIFGWLYWKRGLEAAMISHFSADIVLHVLLAL